jgi:hypothetical protein
MGTACVVLQRHHPGIDDEALASPIVRSDESNLSGTVAGFRIVLIVRRCLTS